MTAFFHDEHTASAAFKWRMKNNIVVWMHPNREATKGAMISFVKSLAVELGSRDITVNSVAPGWVDTEAVEKPFAAGRARIEAAIPLGRVASPSDIAGPILFLASPLARHMTGEILNVNGGSVLCG